MLTRPIIMQCIKQTFDGKEMDFPCHDSNVRSKIEFNEQTECLIVNWTCSYTSPKSPVFNVWKKSLFTLDVVKNSGGMHMESFIIYNSKTKKKADMKFTQSPYALPYQFDAGKEIVQQILATIESFMQTSITDAIGFKKKTELPKEKDINTTSTPTVYESIRHKLEDEFDRWCGGTINKLRKEYVK